MEFEVTDFQTDVLEASRERPVLVDFWAPWCGPCRTLGPTLERLAGSAGGAWELVKVNTDEHPELSMQYGIRGIPAVKLFVDGQVVDEFTGALPEYAVKQWLEKALPTETKRQVARAEALVEDGRTDEAEALLEDVLAAEPTNAKARLLLAQLLAFRDADRAEALVDGAAAFAGPGFIQTESAVKTIARLTRLHDDPEALPDDPVRDVYEAALDAVAERNFDEALRRFIEVIQRNRYYDDDGARKACIALFTLLGEDHPTTRKHRRTFDMALY